MYKINGVLGELSPEELGQTLVHEHISCADWSMRMNFGPVFYEEDKLVDVAVKHFKELQGYGIKTVVDGTPINLGRDIRLIREVSEKSGMNMIASSGFYYMEEPWLASKTDLEIYDLLNYECVHGIAGTDTVPGIMKAAVSNLGVTKMQKKILKITAKLAVTHELPVFCHHDVSIQNGVDIVEMFCEEGLNTKRLILGHCSDSNNLKYLQTIAKTGCYLGMDRLGYCEGERPLNTLENCVKNIVALCEMGYIDQILLSHDMATYMGFDYSWKETLSSKYQETVTDYTYISRVILPELLKANLTESDIETIMITNPARFFAGE